MAGLPWIKVHTDLPKHRKSIILGLELEDPHAWLHMVRYWIWCADNLPSGLMEGDYAAASIEVAAGWNGKRGRFIDAAIKAGFFVKVDGGIEAYGWKERAEAHYAKMEIDKQRMRALRSSVRATSPRLDSTSQRVVSESRGKIIDRDIDIIKEGAKTPSPKRSLSDMLVRVYEEIVGTKYVFEGAKDGKAVDKLLKASDPETIERTWRLALGLKSYPGCGSIAQLASKWNELMRLSEPKPSEESEYDRQQRLLREDELHFANRRRN